MIVHMSEALKRPRKSLDEWKDDIGVADRMAPHSFAFVKKE